MANTEMLKKRMAERGISQSDMARLLGIAPPTMSQKINNLRPFTLDEADTLSRELEIPPDEFRAYFFA